MDYATVQDWTNLYELISNRVSVINQVLGARYDGLLTNPLQLHYHRGSYTCKVCGAEFASFRIYDLPSTSYAYDRLQGLNDGIWFLNRSGRLTFT